MDALLKLIVGTILLAVAVQAPALLPQAAQAPPADEVITGQIEQALRTNVQLRLVPVEISTLSGVVTLRGPVASLVEKARIEQLCGQVRGVKAVDNKLAVQTSPNAIWNTAHRIEAQCAEDPLLRQRELTVKANQGIVTLVGAVQSPYEKSHAERIARQFPGVLFVRNEIRVQTQSDESLRTLVLDDLDRDERLESMLVDVVVDKQVVTLRGYVESPLQKDLAETCAEAIPGVLSVDNRLVVANWPGPSYL